MDGEERRRVRGCYMVAPEQRNQIAAAPHRDSPRFALLGSRLSRRNLIHARYTCAVARVSCDAISQYSVEIELCYNMRICLLLFVDEVRKEHVQGTAIQTPGLVAGVLGPQRRVSKPISFMYIVKIVFAFILIFVLGAIFTLFLDNLPAFILFIKSIM
ncbi:hypothetical protein RJT34_26731 [Clitoria ternatea]|uniref:Uncharacterized protein n=1 Tax=Clitoria ternatea TaxID=43366 RepID=A0AAN9IBR1_CLITE